MNHSIALFIMLWSPVATHATMNVSGPLTANAVSVTGDVYISSVTVSSLTVTNYLTSTNSPIGLSGFVVQTVLSSTTASSDTSSTTLTPIPGLTASLKPKNSNNYVRISLSGVLKSGSGSPVHVSLKRDSTDLGQGSLVTNFNSTWLPVGINILDFPGDTNTHDYSATFKVDVSTDIVTFSASPVGYLLLEEISR